MQRVCRSRGFRLVLAVVAGVAAMTWGGVGMSPGQPLGAAPSAAQPVTPQQALERIFTAERVEADWFDPSFLAQVPVAQVQQTVEQYTGALGSFQRVEPAGDGFTVIFSGGTTTATIRLGADGRIVGLRLGLPRPTPVGGVDEALARFNDLPGRVSVLVTEGERERAALNPDAALAVGSSFKLAVLAALRAEIDAGVHSWSEVVQMKPEWRSLPSGVLQNVFPGTPITLETLAALMISLSDNTAADSLLAIAGREQVEALTARNHPFLSTREFFAIKNPVNSDLLERFRAGDEAERRAVLRESTQRALPNPSSFGTDPVAIDVEWYFSTRELCGLMSRVQDLPAMSLNPGVASASDWARVAYKGGSEPGVLNLTTWLTAKDGRQLCVSATWNNDAALDENAFFVLVGGLIDALK